MTGTSTASGSSACATGRRRRPRGAYAFVLGDFKRIHRSGIIACHYRAAEWRHKAIELAAHDLLQVLDRKAGIGTAKR